MAFGGWQRLPDQAGFEISLVNDTVEWFGSLIAVGCRQEIVDGYPACGAPSVWISQDGRGWQAAQIPEAAAGWILAVGAGGPGLIAVGQVVETPDVPHAAIWTSENGRSWTRVPDSPAFAHAFATWVFAWRARILAGGSGAYYEGLGVRMWSSPDGSDWVKQSTDFGTVTGGGARPFREALVFWGLSDSECPCHQTVWVSHDGGTWSSAPPQPSLDDVQFFTMTEHGGALLAGGGTGIFPGSENRAALWTSTDGMEWATLEGLDAPLGSEISHIVTTEAGLVAAGSVFHDDVLRPLFWIARGGATGRDWLREPDLEAFPGGQVLALHVTDDGLFAFLAHGRDQSGVELWFRPILDAGE